MIAADEYFVRVRQVAKPIEKVEGLGLAAAHREVARMDHDIRRRQFAELPVRAVCVGQMQKGVDHNE